MKVELTTGTAHISVRFSPPYHPPEHIEGWVGAGPGPSRVRTTEIVLTLADGTLLKGVSRCAPGDNFCRFTGKKLAFERLLYSTRNGWRGAWAQTHHADPHARQFVPLPLADREDRRRLWAAVLGPRFAPPRAGSRHSLSRATVAALTAQEVS